MSNAPSPPHRKTMAAERVVVLGLSALAILVLFAFLLTERNFQHRTEGFARLAQSDNELGATERIIALIRKLQADLHAYAALGDESYLREHLAAATQVEIELGRLRDSLGKNQTGPVMALAQRVSEQRDGCQRILDTARAEGTPAAQRLAGSFFDESWTAATQRHLTALRATAERDEREAHQLAAANDAESRNLLILLFTIITTVLGASYLLLRRHLAARRQAEENLHVLSANLERLVEQRTAQLQMVNAELQRETAAHKRDASQLQIIFEAVPSGTVMIDQAGRIAVANRQMETLFGYPRDQLIGRPVKELFHLDNHSASPAPDPASWLRANGAAASGHALRGRRKDAGEFPVEIRLIPVNTGSGKFLMASMIDVTDRERAHAARAHLASIVESTTVGIVSTTQGGLVTSWNEGAERILGYTAAEMIGQPLARMIPVDRRQEWQDCSGHVARGDRVDAFESIRVRKDGRLVPVEISMAPIRDGSGQIVGSSAIVQDISHRKRLESDVLRLSDSEQQRLGRELHDDLGQQLAAIEFICQSLKSKMAERPAWAAQVETVMRLLRHSIATIRSLAHGLAPYVIQSNGLCSALDQLRQTVAASGRVTCRLACGEHIALPNNDASTHLYRIAQEAVSNALRHSGASEITMSLTRTKDAVRLEIADNGSGFPPLFSEPGLGRRTMAYRAQLIGADFQVISTANAGVKIICTLPFNRHEY